MPLRPHYSAILAIEGNITKTDQKLSVGNCVLCNGMKSMIVSDNTMQAGRLGSFFKGSETHLLKL